MIIFDIIILYILGYFFFTLALSIDENYLKEGGVIFGIFLTKLFSKENFLKFNSYIFKFFNDTIKSIKRK